MRLRVVPLFLLLATVFAASEAVAQPIAIDGPNGSGRIMWGTTVTPVGALIANAGGAICPGAPTCPFPADALIDGGKLGANNTFVEFNNNSLPVSFTFTFDRESHISGFRIWNDRNSSDSGICDFQLQFFDSSGAQIGTTFQPPLLGPAFVCTVPVGSPAALVIDPNPNPGPVIFAFPDIYPNARSARLTATASLGTTVVQVREIEFETTCDGTLIDFQPVEHKDALIGEVDTLGLYREDGFQLVQNIGSRNTNSYGTLHDDYYGSTAMFSVDGSSGSLSVEQQFAPTGPPSGYLLANTTFDPISVVLAEHQAGSGAASVPFIGYRRDNSMVVQTPVFMLDGVFNGTTAGSGETFDFSTGFRGTKGVKYIEWPREQQIDNVCIRDACNDGLDNDNDLLVDSADPDCVVPGDFELFAQAPVPGLTYRWVALLASSLVGLGAMQIWRVGRGTRSNSP